MPSHCMDLSARVRFNAESLADLEVFSKATATGVWVRGVGAWRVAVLAHGGMSHVL